MDRFIDFDDLTKAYNYLNLKSNMDRFIVYHILTLLFCFVI